MHSGMSLQSNHPACSLIIRREQSGLLIYEGCFACPWILLALGFALPLDFACPCFCLPLSLLAPGFPVTPFCLAPGFPTSSSPLLRVQLRGTQLHVESRRILVRFSKGNQFRFTK